jgi:uncharacterized membrane protein YuzA (DUF378 family)
MSYCPDCGVDIGDAPVCPLCGAKNPRFVGKNLEYSETSKSTKPYFLEGTSSSEQFTPQERLKIVWEVLSIAFSIGVAILGAINLLVAGKFSWSLYPISTFVYFWLISAAALKLADSRPFNFIVGGLATPLYLFALSLITGNIKWSISLAIPITIFTEIVAAALVLTIRGTKRKGLNIIAYILVGISLVCVGTEIFVDLYLRQRISLDWSAITAIALLPVAGFLVYLHFRVAKTTNLHRLFRL